MKPSDFHFVEVDGVTYLRMDSVTKLLFLITDQLPLCGLRLQITTIAAKLAAYRIPEEAKPKSWWPFS